MTSQQHLLEVQDLKTHFHTFEGVAKAVDDVSFHVDKGETLGVVGESGCGKSVTALSIMRLIKEPPGKIAAGKIVFDGINLLKLPAGRMRSIRGNRISMIFQEPMTSLNPVYTIGDQVGRNLRPPPEDASQGGPGTRAVDMLRQVQVGIAPRNGFTSIRTSCPAGMRQRAMIAMALACNPPILLIADEPTTALDVTIQAQILDLMIKLKEDFGAAIMMITHDLGVIAEIAQRVVVMYAGKVVEQGDVLAIFEDPQHPYTRGLLRSVPKLGQRSKIGRERLQEIDGMVPSLYELPEGCSFNPRCPEAMDICRKKRPDLTAADHGGRVRCWLYSQA